MWQVQREKIREVIEREKMCSLSVLLRKSFGLKSYLVFTWEQRTCERTMSRSNGKCKSCDKRHVLVTFKYEVEIVVGSEGRAKSDRPLRNGCMGLLVDDFENPFWWGNGGGKENSHKVTAIMEKAMAPHSSPLAWKIPWMEEPGGQQSMRPRRVRHNWAASLPLFTFMHWRRKWQPTPVFLPGESQGRGSLLGCRLWGRTESDTTEAT